MKVLLGKHALVDTALHRQSRCVCSCKSSAAHLGLRKGCDSLQGQLWVGEGGSCMQNGGMLWPALQMVQQVGDLWLAGAGCGVCACTINRLLVLGMACHQHAGLLGGRYACSCPAVSGVVVFHILCVDLVRRVSQSVP